ncbi:MAG: hypothetical protein ACFHWZ_03925 [Phycisphaerales bacterium]
MTQSPLLVLGPGGSFSRAYAPASPSRRAAAGGSSERHSADSHGGGAPMWRRIRRVIGLEPIEQPEPGPVETSDRVDLSARAAPRGCSTARIARSADSVSFFLAPVPSRRGFPGT